VLCGTMKDDGGEELGSILYEQPAPEFRFRRALGIAAGAFLGGTGFLFIFSPFILAAVGSTVLPDITVLLLAAMGLLVVGLGASVTISELRLRPFRLHQRGIVCPDGLVLPYHSLADVEAVGKSGRDPIFLSLTRSDGRGILIGRPLTKHVTFQTSDLPAVSRMVTEGFEMHRARSGVQWTEEALGTLSSAAGLRGAARVAIEGLARDRGVLRIDKTALLRLLSDPPAAREAPVLGIVRRRIK